MLGGENLCGPAMDLVLAVIQIFKAFASFSLKRREDPKLNSNLLRIPVPQKHASSILLTMNRVFRARSTSTLIIRVVFLVVLTINTLQSTAQVDSLHKVFRGIDVGITVTPNLYQKQKVIVYTGNDYLTPRFKFGFEGGIILTKNFGKGKFGVSTGIRLGGIPLEKNFFIPRYELELPYPEDIYTYWSTYRMPLEYLKLPCNFTFRKQLKRKVWFAEFGNTIKYHMSTSVGTFGTGMEVQDYETGQTYTIFYHEFKGPRDHFTFDNSIRIGTYFIWGRFMANPSLYWNISYSSIISGDYRFAGIVKSSTGNIIVRQDFLGISLDLMYKGKNR